MPINLKESFATLENLDIRLNFNDAPNPAYIQNKIIECHNASKSVERIHTSLQKELSRIMRTLSLEEAKYEVLQRDGLTKNETVKRFPSYQDRVAYVGTLLEDNIKTITDLKISLEEHKLLEKAVSLVNKNLSRLNNDIKAQQKLMEAQIKGLGTGITGDKNVAHLMEKLGDISQEIDSDDVKVKEAEETDEAEEEAASEQEESAKDESALEDLADLLGLDGEGDTSPTPTSTPTIKKAAAAAPKPSAPQTAPPKAEKPSEEPKSAPKATSETGEEDEKSAPKKRGRPAGSPNKKPSTDPADDLLEAVSEVAGSEKEDPAKGDLEDLSVDEDLATSFLEDEIEENEAMAAKSKKSGGDEDEDEDEDEDFEALFDVEELGSNKKAGKSESSKKTNTSADPDSDFEMGDLSGLDDLEEEPTNTKTEKEVKPKKQAEKKEAAKEIKEKPKTRKSETPPAASDASEGEIDISDLLAGIT